MNEEHIEKSFHLEEVERQAHIPKDSWIIRAECNWYTIVDKDRKWVHRHRGCQTLISSSADMGKIKHPKLQIWINNISLLSDAMFHQNSTFRSEKGTYEMGHTSIAMPFSRQVCRSFGCFTTENLRDGVSSAKTSMIVNYPWPIRFVPNNKASYRVCRPCSHPLGSRLRER